MVNKLSCSISIYQDRESQGWFCIKKQGRQYPVLTTSERRPVKKTVYSIGREREQFSYLAKRHKDSSAEWYRLSPRTKVQNSTFAQYIFSTQEELINLLPPKDKAEWVIHKLVVQ